MTSASEISALLDGEPRSRVSRRSRAAAPTPIQMANKVSNEEFIQRFFNLDSDWTTWIHPTTHAKYTLHFFKALEMPDQDMQACFDMIFFTSGEAYRASVQGWHPGPKKKEMRQPDLRYVLVKDADGILKGFVSLMPTFENGVPVVYCYEIHLLDELQRTGLSKQLMGYLTTAAENIPSVEKVVLSCFVSNTRAYNFYEKLGFSVDEFSPREKKLRDGRALVPDYVTLSRRTCRSGGR